jgi:hypothetical protein
MEIFMKSRIIWSVVALVAYFVVVNIFAPVQGVVSAQLAGMQFANSDIKGISSVVAMHSLAQAYEVFGFVLAVVLGLLWYRPVKDWLKSASANMFIVLLGASALLALLMPHKAYAYYDKNDYTEAYTILPNESAFWISDTGANKDNQVKFDSEAYLNENKIAAKRFIVPHQKLSGSGFWSDFYVPTGRLIIVDRSIFSKEWVDAHDRGTSAKKEGFPCQSKEGINVTAGVAVGVKVKEENASRYLYNFGVVAPKGNRNDPQFIFQSVFYSRTVADVMDDVGRKKIGSLVCSEIGKRDFVTANAEMIPMMETIEKAAKAYFDSVGITLDFIGWADTFNFDHDVQESVNKLFKAQTEAKVAALLAPHVATLQGVAAANAVYGMKPQLPTTYVGNPLGLNGLVDMFLLNGQAGVAKPTQAAPTK